jgi:hypothetical protein
MDRPPLVTDWYNRIQLQWALTTAWLSKGDLAPARIEAQQFVKVAMASPERTFRALAFEANAQFALGEGELPRAKDCTARAVEEMEGFEISADGMAGPRDCFRTLPAHGRAGCGGRAPCTQPSHNHEAGEFSVR